MLRGPQALNLLGSQQLVSVSDMAFNPESLEKACGNGVQVSNCAEDRSGLFRNFFYKYSKLCGALTIACASQALHVVAAVSLHDKGGLGISVGLRI